MSKKSGFSHFNKTQEKNEFEEKNEEEDEGEEEEQKENIIINNKDKTDKEEEKKIHEDPFDYSDDEDEVEDKIADLNSIPNYFEIPKPVNSFKPPLPPGSSNSENPLLKKYAPLDWKTAFPTTYNICNNTLPIYISGNSGPNLICLHGAGHSGLSFAPLALVNKN